MRRFTAEEKLAIIHKVVFERQPVYFVCKAHKISKVTFYKWFVCYMRAKKNRPFCLESRIRKENKHPRSLNFAQKLEILRLVHKHPEYSCHRLSKILSIGHHGVQNFLEKKELSLLEQRLKFSQEPFWKRESAERRVAMIQLYKQGWRIKDICEHFKISKPTFIKWKKRFEEAKPGVQIVSLEDRFVAGANHHKFLNEDLQKQILELVKGHPEWSVHKIYEALPRVNQRSVVGYHGVQNVLQRYNLSTYEQRLAYSRLAEEAIRVHFSLADIPQIPLRLWRMLYAPFATIPKLSWLFTRGQLLLIVILLLGFYFYKIIWAIIASPAGTPVGTFFAAISLTFGLFFFIYSLKYYLTILMVLRLAQSGAAAPDGSQFTVHGSRLGKILSKLGLNLPGFNPISGYSRINPLLVNLEKVELKERPFVSIHVAIYNETKVVERLIQACTSQDWIEGNPSKSSGSTAAGVAAFEVVIVYDSTDETTSIAKEVLADNGWSSYSSREDPPTGGDESRSLEAESSRLRSNNNEQEIFIFTKPDSPTVKLIHRFSREGFKGGALQKALENTDSRAKYICVFEPDFVPYPDTVEQFVKTFQVLGQSPSSQLTVDSSQIGQTVHSSQFTVGGSKDSSVNREPITANPIAAVQGYQWHVLNKSQTWVTRGVRTEYAGSYVIERSGAE